MVYSIKLLHLLYISLSVTCPTVNGLEHQWESLDGIGDPLEEMPVLHTAFVQTGEELHYFSESSKFDTEYVGHRVHQDTNSRSSEERKYVVKSLPGKNSMPFEFDPPFLEFADTAVGVPLARKVIVRNLLNKAVILDSIVGSNVNFRASFFNVLDLPPLESTSFEIVFLPREEGETTSTLAIYTSTGTFIYEVSGRSSSNPYRLAPFVGIRMPFNATVHKQITLHNPHSQTLRVKELASSGGNVHAMLASDVDPLLAEEPVQYWDIRPYQTRLIGKMFITGHMLENITNYVRISGVLLDENGKETRELHTVILSLPLEVTKRPGVFTQNDILDFGLLKQGEVSSKQNFSVFQYQLNGRVEFETIYVEKGEATGVWMTFSTHPPILIHPGKLYQPGLPSNLVEVAFDASKIVFAAGEPNIKTLKGRIIAISRGGKYNLTVPFTVTVFQGELKPVENDLCIQEDVRPPHRRSVRIFNNLPFTVAVWNVSVAPDDAPYFTVRLFERATVIPAGETRPVFLLKYNKKMPEGFGTATFYVYTNASTFRVSLTKYSGKINVELFNVDQDALDFGLIDKNDTRTIRFALRNPNSASITVRGLKVPDAKVYRLYMVGNGCLKSHSPKTFVNPTVEIGQGEDIDIQPQSTTYLDLEMRAPADGSEVEGSLVIGTDVESRSFPVRYTIGSGSLTSIPDSLSFGATHPGKLAFKNLQIFNSFTEDMTVTRLSTLSRDPRFFFEGFDPAHPPVLRSGRLTNLGRVMFMPPAPCPKDKCYLGLPLHTPDGQWFVHGLTLPNNLAEVDSYLYKRQRLKFDNLVKLGENKVNTSITVDTDKAKNIQVQTSAELVWPRLLTRNSIHFPLTALGNFTIVNLTLSNPTALPIAIQVIPLVIYPDAETVVELFREHLLTPLTSHVEMNETLMFSLRDTELFTLKKDSPVPKLREELEGAIPQTVPRFTLSLILKPHMKIRLRLGFLPSDYTLRSSLLLIRNNLTVIEPVVVYGRGARIGMQVEGVEARSKQPLLFEIRHDHLTDCNNPKRLMHKLSSTLTVRRPFTVMNTGEVAFTVVNMSINGVPCENRGFRILNCYPFRLQPNETYSLDIAYTPDFLSTSNEADLQLYMHMNGSSWLYPLSATVPQDMLAKCHRALPRPPFEGLMYYSCVLALVFCLVCVLACAYLEGDRSISCAIKEQHTAARHIFDLNSLDNTNNDNANGNARQTTVQAHGDLVDCMYSSYRDSIFRHFVLFYCLVTGCQSCRQSIPTGGSMTRLQPPQGSSWLVRSMYNIIDGVLQSVFYVWRYSAFMRAPDNRPADNSRSNNNNRKKKRNVVQSVNPVDVSTELTTSSFQRPPKENKETKETTPKTSVVAQPAKGPASTGSKKTGLSTNNNSSSNINNIAHTKLGAKTSVSPKSLTNSKNKKSGAGAVSAASLNEAAMEQLEKTQQLMDDFSAQGGRRADVPEPTVVADNSSESNAPKRQSTEPIRKQKGNEKKSKTTQGETTPATNKEPAKKSQESPVRKDASDIRAPSVPLQIPDAATSFDGFPSPNRPTTPTPSLASSYGVKDTNYLNDSDGSLTSREDDSHLFTDRMDDISGIRKRNKSESEISIQSEFSTVPDWADVSVTCDDVDDDFSAFQAVSGSGSEWGDIESQQGDHLGDKETEKKKGARRGRRGGKKDKRRIKRSSNSSHENTQSSASTVPPVNMFGPLQFSEETAQMMEQYKKYMAAGLQSNWSNINYDPSLYDKLAPTMWPASPLGAGSLSFDGSNPYADVSAGLIPSLAPGTRWIPTNEQTENNERKISSNSGTGSSMWPSTSDSVPSSSWLDPVYGAAGATGTMPGLLGGTSSLFAGSSDFNLWTPESLTLDPSSSWAHLNKGIEEFVEETDETNKKE